MKRFHEIVDEAIRAKGLKLEALAKRCGTHKGYVSGWRRGKVNPPTAKFVRRLAKALDLEPTNLLVLAELEKIDKEVRQLFHDAIESYGRSIGAPPQAAATKPEAVAAAG